MFIFCHHRLDSIKFRPLLPLCNLMIWLNFSKTINQAGCTFIKGWFNAKYQIISWSVWIAKHSIWACLEHMILAMVFIIFRSIYVCSKAFCFKFGYINILDELLKARSLECLFVDLKCFNFTLEINWCAVTCHHCVDFLDIGYCIRNLGNLKIFLLFYFQYFQLFSKLFKFKFLLIDLLHCYRKAPLWYLEGASTFKNLWSH